MKHIEKETCIQFNDVNENDEKDVQNKDENLDMEVIPDNDTEPPITDETDVDDAVGNETVTDNTLTGDIATDNTVTDDTSTDKTVTDNTAADITETDNTNTDNTVTSNVKLTYTVQNYNYTTLEPKENEIQNSESDGDEKNLRIHRRHYLSKGKILKIFDI